MKLVSASVSANPAEKPAPRFSLIQRFVLAVVPFLLWILFWLVGKTWRFDVIAEDDSLDFPFGQAAGPVVICYWHQCILSANYYFQHSRTLLLISESFDGEIIARIAQHFGYTTMRGSSSRGAARALLGLKRQAIDRGGGVAITADGPKGPIHQSKLGPVKLAQLTGAPVLFFHLEPARSWVMRSWDGFTVPKPFTRIVVSWATALHIPRECSPEELEEWRLKVDAALERARLNALDRLGKPRT